MLHVYHCGHYYEGEVSFRWCRSALRLVQLCYGDDLTKHVFDHSRPGLCIRCRKIRDTNRMRRIPEYPKEGDLDRLFGDA